MPPASRSPQSTPKGIHQVLDDTSRCNQICSRKGVAEPTARLHLPRFAIRKSKMVVLYIRWRCARAREAVPR